MSQRHYFLATCLGCTPVLPMPFTYEKQRDKWAHDHGKATGHEVEISERQEQS